MRNAKSLFFSFLSLILCACTGFQDALVFQNEYTSGIRSPADSSSIELPCKFELTVSRGIIATTYRARFGSGGYVAIAQSNKGIFYLAPYRRFEFTKDTSVESRVGGIVRLRDNPAKYFVWFFPYQLTAESWTKIASGQWLPKVRTGIAGISTRPWIENKLIVPAHFISAQ